MRSSRNIPHTLPLPLPTEGNGNSEGRGVQKKAISEGCGLLTEFVSRGLSKIGELLMNNSFSVEQAISYLLLPVLHWSSFIYGRLNAFFTANATVFIDTMSSAHE